MSEIDKQREAAFKQALKSASFGQYEYAKQAAFALGFNAGYDADRERLEKALRGLLDADMACRQTESIDAGILYLQARNEAEAALGEGEGK